MFRIVTQCFIARRRPVSAIQSRRLIYLLSYWFAHMLHTKIYFFSSPVSYLQYVTPTKTSFASLLVGHVIGNSRNLHVQPINKLTTSAKNIRRRLFPADFYNKAWISQLNCRHVFTFGSLLVKRALLRIVVAFALLSLFILNIVCIRINHSIIKSNRFENFFLFHRKSLFCASAYDTCLYFSLFSNAVSL